MDKLSIMEKQLNSLHTDLRRVKKFHKESSKNFKKFYEFMNQSMKLLTFGDICNDVHYTNIMNMSIIEYFNKHILSLSQQHLMIHKKLKEEGNKVKLFKAQIGKKLLNFHSNMKKDEKITSQLSVNKYVLESELLLKELSDFIMSIRDSVSHSLKHYIETLHSFSDIKNNLRSLIKETGETYNDSSPIISRKLDLFLNFGNFSKIQDYSENKQDIFLTRKRTKAVENPEEEFSQILKTTFNKENEEMLKSHRRQSSYISDNYEARRQLLSNYFKMTPAKSNKKIEAYSKTHDAESNN